MCFCLEESISKISFKYYFAFTYDVWGNDNSSLAEKVSCGAFQACARSYGIGLREINRGSGDFSIYESIL